MGAEACPIALSEAELEGELPRVCLCCGAAATVTQPKGFWRQPPIQAVPSVGIIGVISLLLQLSQAASTGQHLLHAPFCDKHANYWSAAKYILLARLGMVAVFVVGLILAAILALTAGPGFALAWAGFCVFVMLGAAGLAIYLQSGRIEQMEPNPDFLVLSSVSKGFRDALDLANPARATGSIGHYSDNKLAEMQQRQAFGEKARTLVLPLIATVMLLLVSCVLCLIGPPSGLPQPAGGPQTRGTDLHCYEQITRGPVNQEARSYLRWHSADTVEGWDHATTVKHVDKLYALGAQKVYYHPVLLMVVLPSDADARARILRWEFTEIRQSQGEQIPDEKQWYMMVAAKR